MQNNQAQIGFSDEFTYNNLPIKYDITTDSHLGLYVEDCARALGVTQTKNTNNGTSTTIRWERVYGDLIGIGVIPYEGKYTKFSKRKKYYIRNKLKQMLIDKESFVIWCNRVNTIKSDMLIQLINTYKTSRIIKPKERLEINFLNKLEEALKPFNIKGIRQYNVLTYRIDYYIPELKLAIEYDENDHKNYTYEQHELRQKQIEKELECRFIRVSDSKTDAYNIGVILQEIINEKVA